ncbi:MAG: OmpA family protein [Deltaproteobacteria bacterium]|nr:OmpA family protein [Deltaproteobacteria bacterium]
MVRRFGCVVASFVVCGTVALSGCKPTYPACQDDEHCKEKGEVCLNQQCQECRDDAQCKAKYNDDKHECVTGRCQVRPECRRDPDCAKVGEGLVCRGNKCVPECTVDTDCAEGSKCQNQKCVAECTIDTDCGAGTSCVAGRCQTGAVTKISGSCQPANPTSGDVIATETVNFDFDQYDLTVSARSILDQNAQCLQQAPEVTVVLEGHCDERGTQEYNLALGEKRANTVKSYLKNLGIDVRRMQTRSKGENEPVCRKATDDCWSKNRRVEFLQQRGTR